MPDAPQRIEQLRQFRVRPPRDLTIASVIRTTASSADRTHKKLGQLIELWEQFVPSELAAQTSITGLRAGTLHVSVDSSSVAYDLDRLLREGLEQQLRAYYRGTLVRVRLRVGS